jgi:hypothetical protein
LQRPLLASCWRDAADEPIACSSAETDIAIDSIQGATTDVKRSIQPKSQTPDLIVLIGGIPMSPGAQALGVVAGDKPIPSTLIDVAIPTAKIRLATKENPTVSAAGQDKTRVISRTAKQTKPVEGWGEWHGIKGSETKRGKQPYKQLRRDLILFQCYLAG